MVVLGPTPPLVLAAAAAAAGGVPVATNVHVPRPPLHRSNDELVGVKVRGNSVCYMQTIK